ncbi:hypothetical protein SDJN03_22020, partial [Cucurbita argyrosperma subsp. sororia]
MESQRLDQAVDWVVSRVAGSSRCGSRSWAVGGRLGHRHDRWAGLHRSLGWTGSCNMGWSSLSHKWLVQARQLKVAQVWKTWLWKLRFKAWFGSQG